MKLIGSGRTYVITNNRVYYYAPESGRITIMPQINKLLSNKKYFKDVIHRGFKYYKRYVELASGEESYYILVTTDFLKLFASGENVRSIYDDKLDFMYLDNLDLSSKNIDAFYTLFLEIEASNMRMKYMTGYDENLIYVRMPPDDVDMQLVMTKAFGETVEPEWLDKQYGAENIMLFQFPKLIKS